MGRIATDITGQRFGSLVAIRVSGKARGGQPLWYCVCDCGLPHLTTGQTLRANKCVRCPACAKLARAEGMRAQGSPTPLPALRIDIWVRESGQEGGFALASVKGTEHIVLATPWTRNAIPTLTPYAWPLLEQMMIKLASAGHIPPRPAHSSVTRWIAKAKLHVEVRSFTAGALMLAKWAQAVASGVVAQKTIDGMEASNLHPIHALRAQEAGQ